MVYHRKQNSIKIQGYHIPVKIVFGCKSLSFLDRNTKNYDSHCFYFPKWHEHFQFLKHEIKLIFWSKNVKKITEKKMENGYKTKTKKTPVKFISEISN